MSVGMRRPSEPSILPEILEVLTGVPRRRWRFWQFDARLLDLDPAGVYRPVTRPWRAGVETPEAAWEALATHGLIPPEWVGADRRFLCEHCLGQAGRPCTACLGLPTRSRPYPPTVLHLIHFLRRGPASLLAAESLIDSLRHRLRGYRPLPKHLAWVGLESPTSDLLGLIPVDEWHAALLEAPEVPALLGLGYGLVRFDSAYDHVVLSYPAVLVGPL